MPYLVGNPEDRFSHVEAHISMVLKPISLENPFEYEPGHSYPMLNLQNNMCILGRLRSDYAE